MKSRFLAVRFFAGMFVAGAATPVNVPFAAQAESIESAAPAHVPAKSALARIAASRDAGVIALAARGALGFGPHGEIPCDSGEWKTSGLIGPHSQVMAALGYGAPSANPAPDQSALTRALGDTPADNSPESNAAGEQYASRLAGGSGLGGFSGFGGGSTTGTTGGAGSGSGVTGGTAGGSGGSPTGGDGPTTTVIGNGTGTTDGGFGTIDGGVPTIPDTESGSGGFGGTGAGTGTDNSPGDVFTPINPGTPRPGGGGIAAPIDPPAPDGPTVQPNPPIAIVTPPAPTGPGTGSGGGSIGNPSAPQMPIAAVPEPSSWATMLCGFAAIGMMLRTRRRAVQA